MTKSDLIVAAPWIVFAVALTIVWFLLRRPARSSRQRQDATASCRRRAHRLGKSRHGTGDAG